MSAIKSAVDDIDRLRKARNWLEQAKPDWFNLFPRAETTYIGNIRGWDDAQHVLQQSAMHHNQALIDEALVYCESRILDAANIIRDAGETILKEEADRKDGAQ